jgi:hypothetical protein
MGGELTREVRRVVIYPQKKTPYLAFGCLITSIVFFECKLVRWRSIALVARLDKSSIETA